MSDIAIRVENLSKLYHIGRTQQRHDSLRDTMVAAVQAPLARLRRDSRSSDAVENTIWALRDVSFEVKRGEVVGIIGRNGAGKSTLLKILSRITEPTKGRVTIKGRVGSLLEVGTGFHPELTGRENVYLNGAILGMRKAEIDRSFDEIVAFAEFEKFLDTPVKRYSSGMYVRLAFSVAAHLEPEILLIDEVLAVGDAAFQRKCLGKMGNAARGGRTVLFISHNMAAVSALCNRTIVLERGQVVENTDTSTAISRYLQLSGPKHSPFSLNAQERSGDGPIRFTSFYCETGMGEITHHLVSGQRARLVLGYESSTSQEHKNIEVAILIYASDGTRLANLSNYYFHEESSQVVPPQGQFSCILPKLALRSGSYSVDLFCSVNGGVSDWIRSAATFEVTDGDYYGTGKITQYYTGTVFLDHIWALHPGTASSISV